MFINHFDNILKKMEIGERVSCIETFSGVDSHCSFACFSGKYGYFDSETNQIISSKIHENPILTLTKDESSNVIYFADRTCMYRYDLRTNENPQFMLQLISDIICIGASGSVIAASTEGHGIILGDCRKLENSRMSESEPVPSTAISFMKEQTCNLLAGYRDSYIGEWETISGLFTEYELPELMKPHKLEVLSCFSTENNVKCACYSSGISIYRNTSFSHETLNKSCLFNAATAAPCFGPNYAIVALSDGSIFPIDISDLSEMESISVPGDDIKSISANSLIVASLFDGDDGAISVFTPEDFASHKSAFVDDI